MRGWSSRSVRVRDGAPAPATERVRLFQRRHYMDEECLFRYEAGGMNFNHIQGFDRWLLRDENCTRLLPTPRCVVAFRVRRTERSKENWSLHEHISFAFSGEGQLDKLTFLYMRNGDQVFRLNTEIEFKEKLFPDMDRAQMDVDQRLYYEWFTGVDDLITENEYEALVAAEKHEQAEHDRKFAEDNARDPKSAWRRTVYERAGRYHLWSRDDVRYDDVCEFVRDLMDHHNRLAMVLQGLFDRSHVFAPHAPVQLWTADGFASAIELVYDDSRALVSGPPPNFEAYRQRLNTSLKVGSITVGQERVWLEREAERENARQRADYRIRNRSDYDTYRPYGDPGPGKLATVTAVTGSKVVYRWFRERKRPERWGSDDNLPATIAVDRKRVLHVNAYTPGDYLQFFADPRTRAEYLQWAPALLSAEDWHASQKKERT